MLIMTKLSVTFPKICFTKLKFSIVQRNYLWLNSDVKNSEWKQEGDN